MDCVSIQSHVSSHRSPLRFLVLFSFQRTTTIVHCPFYTFHLDVSIRGLNRSVENNLVEHSGGLLFCPSFNSLLSHDKGGSRGGHLTNLCFSRTAPILHELLKTLKVTFEAWTWRSFLKSGMIKSFFLRTCQRVADRTP